MLPLGSERVVSGPSSQFVADDVATREAYSKLASPDPKCCLACASFLEAVERSMLPDDFVDLLVKAGVDVRKPLEVWGEPEEGFLQGFYNLVGRLAGRPWAGESDGAFEEPRPGFTYYVTEHISMNDPAFTGRSLLQIEFTWQGDDVRRAAQFAQDI